MLFFGSNVIFWIGKQKMGAVLIKKGDRQPKKRAGSRSLAGAKKAAGAA